MQTRRRFLSSTVALAAAGCLPQSVLGADPQPNSDIYIIAAHKQGGGVDMVSRTLAPLCEARFGHRRVAVKNMVGASGSIAARFVRSNPADGTHWLAIGSFGSGLRAMGLDDGVPWRDWQFCGIDSSVMGLAVPIDSPIRDLEDLIRRAVDKPMRLPMAVNGMGGTWHLAGLLLARATGADFRFIPYDGGKAATIAAVRGEVDVVCSGVHEQIGHLKAGQLRSLGVGLGEPLILQGQRLESIVHSIPELADYAPIGGGAGIALRRETDAGILQRIAGVTVDSIADPVFQDRVAAVARFPAPSAGEQADRRAAQLETAAANLLATAGLAKRSPAELGLPSIEAFDEWWPPRDYRPRIEVSAQAQPDALSQGGHKGSET